ncbi:universal stress protein [Hoyosella rhizosphaerae]|uniref:Universal stress protein n=1 Tax=Hoyosella rhizosphaerae TaxID=1755582 RepID=A0A916XDF6_9ACTN|nr:universal stress protein [Hoyosella rhizosphaerae]MBN4927685.1 universal stress protein [Hoyosella rhizosphaerae]GGC62482.1 universal stress protein [Hoyosella rhizosphaerae]
MTSGASDVVLIAYDGSENAKRAIRHAGHFLSASRAVVVTAWEPLARQAARISGLSGVMQPGWVPDVSAEDAALADAKMINEEGIDLAQKAGLQSEGRCIETITTVWAAIVDIANELDVNIIVTGTRGATGLRALLHSSVADQVLKHCHRPVLIVPPCDD